MSKKIRILGYGSANYGSIINIFRKLDQDIDVTENYKDIKDCDLLILPGVGTFPKAINFLKKKKIFEKIRENIISGQPTLGICLGMQLLSNSSTELGYTKGLNLISGSVKKIPNNFSNIGWNDVFNKNKRKFGCFYFQHSYYLDTKNERMVNAYFQSDRFRIPAVIRKKNIIGFQFHPEKSQKDGYNILNSLIKEI